ncbi:helix-turn-helix transcriptional regulator [Chitinophaga rhizophila]|uniref:Transcriptional regulator n=1 Tax=Chitinophaga rhizophila TaxID=2866212 RepID=A0ABS7GAE7_9BACT|nr:metalloregulator ArsR/SmtB family transcription factor [Chitinophaga rhizophila]MBW8684637.1 transcriptional regulator [Chitinophaga rhizophila]
MMKQMSERILMLLKMRREATSLLIAQELAITKEGARKHLLSLENQQLVTAVVKSEGVGRPSTYYSLTEKGLAKFPDAHADITVQLLKSIRNLLGENALDLLIGDRETNVYKRYAQAMEGAKSLEDKLTILTQKRSEEGYMAEWKQNGDAYLLIENHCPICAAAQECQGFCRSELNNFRQLIGNAYAIERIEHIINNSNRCAYEIKRIEAHS